MEIHLPDGVTLTGDFQLITFNDLARLCSADSDPSTMDVTTQPLSIPQAHQVFGTWLRQLGLPETQADEWRQRVEAPEGTQNGTGLVIKGGDSTVVGYMRVGASLRYTPGGQTTVAALTLYWGPRATEGE